MSTRPIDLIGAGDALTDLFANVLRAGGEFVDVVMEANKAIDADRKFLDAATEALFTAYYAKNGDPANIAKAQAAEVAANQAAANAARAGQGLSAEAKTRRVDAADKAATEATQAALKAATEAADAAPAAKAALDMAAQKASARARAATVVASAAASGAAPVLPTWDPKDPIAGQSFWSRQIVGPLTGTHLALAGVAGGVLFAFRRRLLG